jgi:MoaA/NifB/PqqE/SkfB family radical SAM enzyme
MHSLSPNDMMRPSADRAAPADAPLRELPLLTLYLSERCNSRCVTCDYWQHGHGDLSLESVEALLPSLAALRTRSILISGGEPLLNPAWAAIAQLLRDSGLRLWLLTSGLSLVKHAARIAQLFDAVTVSLDGTNPATYCAIRGLDAFENVCAGIRALAATTTWVSIRVTIQRTNYRELPEFVTLAHQLGAREVSFLAVDVANAHAFGREGSFATDVALQQQDLAVLAQLLESLERDSCEDFRSGFIAQSPLRLQHILRYFAAVCGNNPYPPVRCNAPEFSAVMDAHGRVHPCFFIRGPGAAPGHAALGEALNAAPMAALRRTIRTGGRTECERCVCSLWRDPATRAALHA